MRNFWRAFDNEVTGAQVERRERRTMISRFFNAATLISGGITMWVRKPIPVLVWFACFAFVANAQSVNGTLSGTVSDPTGASVIAANVAIRNMDTREVRNLVTNRDGYFAVNTLPASTYEVTVSAKGFSKYHASGIALTGGESRSMSITLKMGEATETVEVDATITDMAPTDSGEKTFTIGASDLEKFSLVSRDATEIVSTMPGAIMAANGGVNRPTSDNQVVGMNVNGPLSNSVVNGQSVDVTMDGAHTFDPGASGNSVPVTANQDMISEIKILTSNFTADNPKGPVVVNTVSRAGGKDFHGDVRFMARNDAMNSTEHFEKANHVAKPDSSYYYPGFGVGGPVFIPGTRINKNRDKLFFHESYEFYKQTFDYGVERAYVATPANLNGDFSQSATFGNVAGGSLMNALPVTPNWTTGVWGGPWVAYTHGVSASRLQSCTIHSGVLAPSCIDPNAQVLLKTYLPEPTTSNGAPDGSTGFNYIKDFTGPLNSDQNMAKVDWDLTDSDKVTVVYNRERQTADWILGMWTMAASDNTVPSPTPIIGKDQSDFVAATFTHVFSSTMTSETRVAYTYLNYPESPSVPSKLQRADISGFTLKGIYGPQTAPMIATWGSGFPNLGEIGYGYHPDFTCFKKIPSGGEDLTKIIGKHDTKYGVYLEWDSNVQDNWGDYMGSLSYANYDPSASKNMYADALMGFAHTGYAELAQPPSALTMDQWISSFYAQDDWKLTRRMSVQYGLRFDHYGKAYQPTYGLAIFNLKDYSNDPSQLNNNTGVEWHSQNKNVPVSGASSRPLFFSPRLGLAWDLFGNGHTVARGGWGKYRAYDSLQSTHYTNPSGTAVGSVKWGCAFNDTLCPSWEDIDTHAVPNPASSFGHLGLGSGLKSIYTMDPGDDEQPLVSTYSVTIDQELPSKMTAEVSYVGNSSSFMQNQFNLNRIPLGTMHVSGTCSTACVQTYRPYQNYQVIYQTMTGGKARFDSMQASLHRTTGLTTFMLNYTYSKALGDAPGVLGQYTSAYSDYGVKEFYGVLPNNRPNVFSALYVVRMPKVGWRNSLVRQSVNGWEISGTSQVESGANLTSNSGWNLNMTLPSTLTNTDPTHVLGSPDATLQPVLTCNPRSGLHGNYFLNSSCITYPTTTAGTTHMPYLPGPKFWKSDLTLMKQVKIREHQGLEFRAAAFNFLNHGLLSFAPGDSNLKAAFNANGQLSDTFGLATAHYGQRIMEFATKFTF